MECAVCGSEKYVQTYGSTYVPLCKEHNKGMKQTFKNSRGLGPGAGYPIEPRIYFGFGTGGGIRIIRKPYVSGT